MDLPKSDQKLLSVSQAAKYLGVNQTTLRRWDKAGKLKPKRTVGDARRYPIDHLENFKQSQITDTDFTKKKEVTIGEAAELLGVTTKTLRLWEKQGKIASKRNGRNQRVFKTGDVLNLANNRQKLSHYVGKDYSLKAIRNSIANLQAVVISGKISNQSIKLLKNAARVYRLGHFHLAARPHSFLTLRYGWYSAWHRFRYHPHVHWVALGTYFIGVITGVALVLSGNLHWPVFGAGELQDLWDFTNPGDYSLSDENLIGISGSSARLKTLNYASDSNTVALFHLDEEAGGTANDSSDNNNDGTVTDGSWVSGNLNNALSLNGTTSYINIPDDTSLDLSSDNTLEGWTKFDSAFSAGSHSQLQGVITRGDYRLYFDNETGKLVYELANSSATTWTQQAGGDIKGSWDLNGKLAIESQVIIGGNLYVGAGNAVGDAEVWKYNGTTWTQIGGDGKNSSWLDQTFEDVWSLAANGTTLYAGLGSSTGDGEVWSCDTSSNCSTWTKIGGDGINSGWPVNFAEYVVSMTVMDGNLYVGLGYSNNDARIYKWNGSAWTWAGGYGVGAPYNAFTTGYEGVYSLTNDGTNIYAGLGYGSAGDADVWKLNGTAWTQIGGDGTGWAAATFEYAYTMTYFGGNLYVGLGSTANDAEVWRYNGASWMQVGGDSLYSGWAANYELVYSLMNDGTYLYAGIGNSANEGEVWRCTDCNTATPSWNKFAGDGQDSSFNGFAIVHSLSYSGGVYYTGIYSGSGSGEVWKKDGTWSRIGGNYLNDSWGFYNLQSVESMIHAGDYIYAGTGNATAGNALVWRYDDSTWTRIGGQGLNNSWAANTYEAVWSTVSYNGQVYVGLGSSANDAEVWRWNGSTWSQIGGDGTGWGANYDAVYSLAAFGGNLYAGLGASTGEAEIWRYNGTTWTKVGGDGTGSSWNTSYESVLSMAVLGGRLYAGIGSSTNDAELWQCTGCGGGTPSWAKVGGDGVNSSWNNDYEQVDSLNVYNGKLITGLGTGGDDAEVWEFNGTDTWTRIGGDEVNGSWEIANYERVRSLITYNGDLYAGLGLSQGDGEVWKYNGSSWTQVGGDALYSSWPVNQVESVASFAVYKGKLYAGTGDSANIDAMVWSYGNNGYLESDTDSFDTSWHHIAATYDGTTMKIYIDGVLDNSTETTLSIPNSSRPLLIGTTFGNNDRGIAQGFFEGVIDEIRISNIDRSSFNTHPYTASPETVALSSAVRTYGVYVWDSFSATDNGLGTITFRLSYDGGTTWKYWDSDSWETSSSLSQVNDETTVSDNIGDFPVTNDGILWQAILDGDGTQRVTLNTVTIVASSDTNDPDPNASNLAMKKSAGGSDLNPGDWTNGNSPYFSWDPADDAESGMRGYCLYLGQNPAGDPLTSKGILGTSPVSTVGTTCGFIVEAENINFATESYRGATWLESSDDLYYFKVKAVDIAGNIYNTSASFNFHFDNTLPENPDYITAPSGFISTKTVTLTWPTSGENAPSDGDSGLAGLQYRIGSGGIWYGDNHNGNQDMSDLLTNDGSYTTVEIPDFAALIEGTNTIYFRTWDNAGNITTSYVTAIVKINMSTPSSPQNLDAIPGSNTANSFAFEWDPPATYQGDVNNITYCYTVNTLPSGTACSWTSAGVTSLSAGPYATQPQENTFYVVAKDEAGNINYTTYNSTTFIADTSAPGIPQNPDIADISVKATSNWKLAVTWEEPEEVGAGVASYKIFRSTDNINFTQTASTSGESYVDTGLSQVRYYYKVKACDSANNCGAFSSVVDELPTGKYTEPAALVSNPKVSSISTRRATISWVTERTSDSRISFGLKSGSYFSEEVSKTEQVTDHEVTLNNLTAGTLYFFKAKWTDEDGNTGVSSEYTFTTKPPPTIKEVVAKNINLTSAIIQFTSKDATKVKLYFGKSGDFGGLKDVYTSTTESTYTVELTGLDDGTKYFYKLNPLDEDSNGYEGNVYSFNTLPRPRISNLKFDTVPDEPTSTIQVTWGTNVPTTSTVNYQPTSGVEVQVFSASLKTDHKVILRELADDTIYTITASGRDGSGNLVTSDSHNFRTALDTRPPKVTNLTVENAVQGSGGEAKAQLIVSWNTDEPASSQVEYGEGTGGSYSNRSVEDTNMVSDHAVIISELTPSKTYHLRAVSRDKENNEGTSDDYSAITARASENALDIILGAIKRSLGFLGNPFGVF